MSGFVRIFRSGGNDNLFGEGGNDLLFGGLDSDFLFGGEGNDLFVLEYFNDFSSTNDLDIVADFVQGEDRIDVSTLGISDFNTMLAISEDDNNGNVVFRLQYGQSDGNYYSLKINGLSRNQLQATDFKYSTDMENRNFLECNRLKLGGNYQELSTAFLLGNLLPILNAESQRLNYDYYFDQK